MATRDEKTDEQQDDEEITGEDVLRTFAGDEAVDDPGEVGHEPADPENTPVSDSEGQSPL